MARETYCVLYSNALCAYFVSFQRHRFPQMLCDPDLSKARLYSTPVDARRALMRLSVHPVDTAQFVVRRADRS